jgi:MFS family permease
MAAKDGSPQRMPSARKTNTDSPLLFTTRIVRLFAYGSLSVVLVLYLARLGFSEVKIGLMLTLTLVGDAVISLWLTTNADRIGRKRMLWVGAGLMIFAGILFAVSGNFLLLLLAATIGVISPSGYEVGPFLAIEQASLSQITPNESRTRIFAWYTLAGSFATAFGSLCGGGLVQLLQNAGTAALISYRVVILGYTAFGAILVLLFGELSPSIEPPQTIHNSQKPGLFQPKLGLYRSQAKVLRLAALFSIDAFAGGFVLQSIVAYWFFLRFNVSPGVLGGIFFGANLLAGISALSAAWVARRIGLVRTMVFTHLPSNVLLILVPFMPTLSLAILVLFLRFSISQMDVPSRQSYTMALVEPDERSAASGVTNIARTIGSSLAPVLAGPLLANPLLLNAPFVIAGSLKIVYDLLIYMGFRSLKPPEENSPPPFDSPAISSPVGNQK